MGPRLSAGKKVRALRMRITLTSSTVNSAVFTGKAPGEGGTLFLLARLPAKASTGTSMRKRPASMVQPSITLYHQDFVHETVNHLDEYVRGEVHTQGIDNFWSLLKRGLRGTYIAVEPFHLDRYVTEQMFRYNNRATKDNPLDDRDRFMLAVSQIVGKRITYAELTGKGGETETEAF